MTACFSNPALPAGLARRWRGLCRVGLPALLALATPLAMLLALGIGRFPLPPTEVLGYALAKLGWLSLPPARLALLDNLIIDIRLPRVLTAVLVGSALACSGAAYQAVFRNPLVSPGLLGVLAGAAAGAALGMLYGGDWRLVQLGAFALGGAAVLLGVLLASWCGGALITLVLGGMISGALFTAILSISKYLADPYNQLPAIVYWLMGSLAMANLDDLARLGPPMLLAMLAMCLCGRGLDALSMGDDEARSLGVPVRALRYGVIALATLASALTVSLAGMIGWVGLLIPHLARLLAGPGNARLLPVSACLGAIFLLCADGLARTLTTTEIPLGILTELLGIPAFVLVLRRARHGWTA